MSRPKFSGETALVLLCMQGELLAQREAETAFAQGDAKLAAWWEGRAADWRRYMADARRELDCIYHARATAAPPTGIDDLRSDDEKSG